MTNALQKLAKLQTGGPAVELQPLRQRFRDSVSFADSASP